MMVNHIVFSLLVLFTLPTIVIGQEYNAYQWDDQEVLTYKDISFDGNMGVLKKHIQYDYRTNADGDFMVYYTVHMAIKALNDEAVAQSNRIYIQSSDNNPLIDIEARVIREDGSVVNFDKDNIKEIKGEDENQFYKIFAIEGAEVGSIIEYYYTVLNPGRYFGREYLSFAYPIYNFSFELICSSDLEYAFQIYKLQNTEVSEDVDSVNSVIRYRWSQKEINPVRQEEFSNYANERGRIEFRADYNHENNSRRLNTWYDVADRIGYMMLPSENELDFIDQYVKTIDVLDSDMSTKDSVRAIEHFIKSSIFADESAGGEADQIGHVIENSFGSERGVTRLIMAVLEEFNFPNEIVLVSRRGQIDIDPEFESWNSLNEYLVYIPKIEDYIAPYAYESRCGFLPQDMTHINALHCVPKVIREELVFVPKFHWIPAYPSDQSADNMIIDVSFDEEMESNEVKTSRIMSGHNSSFFNLYVPQMDPTQLDLFLNDVVQFQSGDSEIESIEISHKEFDDRNWLDPITIETEFVSDQFIENAGDIVLFAIGDLIGEQTEMYSEDERTTEIHNDFNRSYVRKISVQIPDGYTIDNPEDIIMNFSVEDNDREVYVFRSEYEYHDNTLVVNIDEFYDQIDFTKSRYEEFREVINAAADWNKVVLVMREE